jgi:hypothetical protein
LGGHSAEVVLQVRQYFQGERATATEWRSLGLIVLTVALAGFPADPIARALPNANFRAMESSGTQQF